MTDRTIWIFSYGTLRQPEVQIGIFGRELESEADALTGHVTRLQKVTDPQVIALSGSDEHPALVETGNPEDEVEGLALAVDEAEMALADGYEAPSRYRRAAVRLKSGRNAYIFIFAG